MIRRTILSIAILSGLVRAASQADQLIMSASYPDAYAISSEFGSAADSIPVSKIVYVSASYSGAKRNGTLNHPYTSIDSALAHVTSATRIVFEPGAYTSAGGAFPAYPLHLDGSGATLTLLATDTIRSSAYITNLNMIGDVVVNAPGSRVVAHGGVITGNITVAAGNYSSDARRNVGNITVSGGLANIKGASIAGRVIHTGGLLTLTNDSISQTSASGTVTSTASTGAMYVNLCYLLNPGTGPAIDVSGSSLAAHAIVLNNNYIYSAGTYSGVMGAAAFEMSDCDTVQPFSGGGGILGTNSGALGSRTLTGQLTGTATTSISPFYANNPSTGRGFYADNPSSGTGFYANNASTGRGFTANNPSTGYGFYAYNASTGRGFTADNPSTGTGFYAYNSSSGTGFYANNTSTGRGFTANNASTATGDAAYIDASSAPSTGRALYVAGGEASAWTTVSAATTLYKYSNRRVVVTSASTLTIDATAIAARSEWIITSRNVAVTIATSGSLIYKGAALAASVTVPATTSAFHVTCDGTYVYVSN